MIDQYGLIYIALLIIGLFFTNKAKRTNKKKYIYLTIVLISLVMGFRDYSVGIDSMAYKNNLENIKFGNMNMVYGMELSFKLICYYIMKVLPNVRFIFLIMAFITNALILGRLWDYRDISDVDFTYFVYFVGLYFLGFNISRQILAAAIVFWGTRFLENRKYIKFILVIVLASLIHRTAYIGIVFLALEVLFWKYLSNWQKRLIILSLITLPGILPYVISYLKLKSHYFEITTISFGLLQLAKTLMIILIVLVESKVFFAGRKEIEDRINYRKSTVLVYYILGNVLTYLGYMFSHMDRVAIYFSIFEGVFWSLAIKNTKNKINRITFTTIPIILLLYQFVMNFIGNGQGQFPYIFGGF